MTEKRLLGPSPGSNALPQEEILQHKLPFPPYKRTAAGTTGYLAIIRLRPSFKFDHLIVGAAVRACEWIECASRHGTPPANSRMLIDYGTLVWAVAQSIRSINVASIRIAFELLRLRRSYSRIIHLVVAPFANSGSL